MCHSKHLFRTVTEEIKKLIQLKKQSLGRRIANVEEIQGEIAGIFNRLDQARERLMVGHSLEDSLLPKLTSLRLDGYRINCP